MRPSLATALVILGVVFGGAAQAPPRVEVRGLVRDAVTGRVIRGASVQIGQLYNSSDADGRFSIAGVSPGKQLLMVFREDYLLAGIRKPEPGHSPIFRDNGIKITVPTESPFEMDVYLSLAPHVSGTVVTVDGQPVEGLLVIAYRLIYDAFGERTLRGSRPAFSSMTDDRGEFAIVSLPPGEYVFRVEDTFSRRPVVPTYYPASLDFSKADSVHLRPGDDIRLRPLVLQNAPLLWLTLKVVDEAGDEIGVPTVNARRVGDVSGLVYRRIVGNTLRLTAGLYEVETGQTNSAPGATQAKLARTSIEIRDANVTLPITVVAGTKTTVRVLHEKQGALTPVGGVVVRLVPKDFIFPLQPFAGTTGADGTLSFAGIPQGSYGVTLPSYSENGDRGLPSDPPLKSLLQDVCMREIRQGDVSIAGDEVRIAGSSTTLTILLRDSTTRIEVTSAPPAPMRPLPLYLMIGNRFNGMPRQSRTRTAISNSSARCPGSIGFMPGPTSPGRLTEMTSSCPHIGIEVIPCESARAPL